MTAPTRRGRTGERREQILDVALRLFAEHGAVTTRQIAQAVGISQPSLYAHFGSVDEVADELCVRAFGALAARFGEVLADRPDPWDRLEALGRAYIEFGLDHPDMYRIAFIPARPHDHAAMAKGDEDPGMAAGLNAFDALTAVVAEIRGSDDELNLVLAQSIWASVHGLTSLLITKPGFPWAERERLIATHLGLIRRALA